MYPNEVLDESRYPMQGNINELSTLGAETPQEAFDDLMGSPFHVQSLMRADKKYIGVGFADED